MLLASEKLTTEEGRVEGSFDSFENWDPVPYAPDVHDKRQQFILLGDETSGPAIVLTYSGPEKIARGKEFYSSIPPHLHRSPTFRISLGHQNEQMLINNKWFGDGDYWILDANKFYNDPNGNDGCAIFNVFADRRGVFPVFRLKPGMTREQMDAYAMTLLTPPLDATYAYHDKNEDAVAGAAISTRDGLDHGGQARGSIHDQTGWTLLSDGSRVAVVAIGDPTSGPLIIMTANQPGTLEAPALRYEVDTFRMIARGTCSIGDREYGEGEFVAPPAGTEIPPVSHGAEGSIQLMVISDRRGWRPVDYDGTPVVSARWDEIAKVLALACKPDKA
jgi:hypothetical protein